MSAGVFDIQMRPKATLTTAEARDYVGETLFDKLRESYGLEPIEGNPSTRYCRWWIDEINKCLTLAQASGDFRK